MNKKQEKGILIDCGRKYWSYEDLEALLELMYRHKFNYLQLHFSDNEGLGIECKTFPKLASKQHLTHVEIQNLLRVAQMRGIEIIPEFDMPGHLGHILKIYPQYRLPKGNRFDDHALNILSVEATQFIEQILSEYMQLFKSCKKFHIGADEFINFETLADFPQLSKAAKASYGAKASGLELYVVFVNQIIEKLSVAGFQVRVWNDGFYRKDFYSEVELSKEVEVTFWTQWHKGMNEPETWLEQGYKIVNFNDNYLYYVLGEAAGYSYPTADKIRSDFDLLKFSGEHEVAECYRSQILGAYISVWADVAEAQTTEIILKNLARLMPALSEKILL
ncbi:lacto-N-biosidase [Lactococcus hodotermopsidis]|uniref:Lacto-N-biosidase n=1 Tax=Pseudolactococcus hodotermopsidis TaxID=2709157 RepID=A0A6A0BB67_9LACT|nr:family 20 glycosylhydrolase [Lactococcus hodotermopsidis]GFH42689.1 lacto-N-biosidase [Lactococcus hodotermopsidis]